MEKHWWLFGLAAVAGYGYMNGWGASFGICPPGYTAAGGQCTNTFLANNSNAPSTSPIPTTALPTPQMWAWSGTAWVAVTPTPSWP